MRRWWISERRQGTPKDPDVLYWMTLEAAAANGGPLPPRDSLAVASELA